MYHKSIRTLPIYNFYEILNTGNLEFLYKDEIGDEDLEPTWDAIYNEYCKVAEVDNRNFKQKAKVNALKVKFVRVELLLKLCKDDFIEVRKSAKDALRDFNFIFRTDQPFDKEYDRLHSQLRSLETKIKIEEDKLPKEDKKEAKNLKKQLNAMKESIVLMDFFPKADLDIYTIPVEKWIALNNHAKEISKHRKVS